MANEVLILKGIHFNKSAVLKMKKGHFMAAYNDEELWDHIQKLKPKPKAKSKKAQQFGCNNNLSWGVGYLGAGSP